MSFKNCFISLSAAAFVVAATATPMVAQDAAPSFSLELNNAADTAEGGCRLTYVAANQTGQALSAISYQVAVFDGQGVVTDLLVLEFGELIEGKTKVVQFDLPRGCVDISRITVNEVAACALADGGEGDFCLSTLETGSRGAIQFGI